jgi:hypothetical protein
MATMTQPEQEAREVLAAEYDEIGDGLNALRIRSGSYVCEEVDVALSALTKALARPTAGIDREVVARLIREHHAVEYGEDGTWSGTARHIGDYKAADAILALHAPTQALWQPIETFDGQPTGQGNPYLICAGDIVGEAWYHDDPEDACGNGWWWAGTSPGEYHDSPVREINDPITHWQPLPDAPIVSGEG